MQARDLALALSVIVKAYPNAQIISTEDRCPGFFGIELPDKGQMIMAKSLEDILVHLNFKYSDAHGACWYAEL
jgi:hypothetical protein